LQFIAIFGAVLVLLLWWVQQARTPQYDPATRKHLLRRSVIAIVVTGIIPCQECFECKNGDSNRCLIYDEIGFTRPGAAADLITVPAWLAHVINDNVSDESAVLAEPTAVVAQAFMKANPKPGSKILIIGCSGKWVCFVPVIGHDVGSVITGLHLLLTKCLI
jgi:hypothetical protein